MLAAKLKKRGIDAFGSGAFGSSRGDRKHKGIDYACEPGTEILSPCIGKVTKIGYPYPNSTYRYVEVTDLSKLRNRVFYIKPVVKKGDQVTVLTVIGKAQDIAKKYSTEHKKMVNHVHYEILNGEPINPENHHD